MKAFKIASVATVAALALAGCGGSAAPDEGANGLTPVSVAAIPIADTAALHLGVEQGFFEDEGLDVTVESVMGGAISVPGVVSGDFDFAFSNVISMFVAQEQGLDLQFVTNGATSTGEVDADIAAIVVLDDAPYKSAADLDGLTVSSNLLSNIGDTTIRHAVDAAGGDGASLNFIEVPVQEAMAALENKQIQAALVVEPFLTQALQTGGRALDWNYVAVHPEMDVSGYMTSGRLVKENPELVEKFAAAMAKSLEFSQENPDEVHRIITTYTQITPELAADIVLPRFKPDFNREAMEILGKAAAKYGILKAEPDLDTLLP
ncbi:nitrate ABC transporter substrate-binding protein [Salinibacterium sp. dk2585]|uniref:ABC transporter substrate-binding protein n=1 Tax=unclassified Salinibacterium TaxID=2632331 RepID=UPI0011C249BF|nr:MULTISPECIES: ABC transporter substrate-binding protein [unclassified Salinibacterium]QEE60423.1 nitrate ABC transporter substrate-binding protein [Salinibacterium sp. dk2585]TXK55496.1 nitrate ABC transporter substrate-binding protein [Salinibacterium sp. dk5596]